LETIILAAGQSSRMGSDKALLDINGYPAIINIINKILKLSDTIYIVLGNNFNSVRKTVIEYFDNTKSIVFIHNEMHEKGMFSSVQSGFTSVRNGTAVMLQLIDQPFILQEVYNEIVAKYNPENLITQPSYEKDNIKYGGHPIIFAPEFKEIVLSYSIHSNLKTSY